jgi:hypothetical protein
MPVFMHVSLRIFPWSNTHMIHSLLMYAPEASTFFILTLADIDWTNRLNYVQSHGWSASCINKKAHVSSRRKQAFTVTFCLLV